MMFTTYIILLSVCVLYFLLYTNAHSFLKCLCIAILIHGYVTIGVTFDDTRGYPTSELIPEKVDIVWGVVVEPSKNPKYDGHIDLWVKHEASLLESKLQYFTLADKSPVVSRVYRIPYTREAHKTILVIQKKIATGDKVGLILPGGKLQKDAINLESAMQRYTVKYDTVVIEK